MKAGEPDAVHPDIILKTWIQHPDTLNSACKISDFGSN